MKLEEIKEQFPEVFEEIKNLGKTESNDEMKVKLEETEKNYKSVKSQLGNANKELDELKNKGKSQEEITASELEVLKQANEELRKQNRLTELKIKRDELIRKNEIDNNFSELITINSDLSDEDLEASIKNVKASQDAFKTNLLKDYSTTGNKIETNKNDDFVKGLIEKANPIVDLTKI